MGKSLKQFVLERPELSGLDEMTLEILHDEYVNDLQEKSMEVDSGVADVDMHLWDL